MIDRRLKLRKGTVEELPLLASFWYRMFEEMGAMEFLARLPADWRDRFVRTYAKRMRDGTQRFEVAVDDGQIVGSCGAVISYSEILDEHVGRIFDVFVEPPYRNAGVASELVRRSLDWLSARGCARATLRASDAGRPVYRRFGFTDVAEMELLL